MNAKEFIQLYHQLNANEKIKFLSTQTAEALAGQRNSKKYAGMSDNQILQHFVVEFANEHQHFKQKNGAKFVVTTAI